MAKLTSIRLKGFKSIRNMEEPLQLKDLNVLIGANGAGKSNFISFFRLMSWMVGSPDSLQLFISRAGGANSKLFDGAEMTPQFEAELSFETDVGTNEYSMRLAHGAPDALIFLDEKYRYSNASYPTKNEKWTSMGSGHRESKLFVATNPTAKVIKSLMKQCHVYQFHNTSETARMRQMWRTDDSAMLKEDAANLTPYLFRLQSDYPDYYRRIVANIRLMNPFFEDFILLPEGNSILLRWSENGSRMTFSADQASDGMLRAIALVTLLMQPTELLPNLLIIDEPELGLHPYAIELIAGLIRSVAIHRQVLVSTQSTTFIDTFEADDIIVVDRKDRETTFSRKSNEELATWLDEYSLSELWQTNIIGGRPQR